MDRRTECERSPHLSEKAGASTIVFHAQFSPAGGFPLSASGASMRRFKIHAIVSACVVTNAAVRNSTAAPMNASRIRTLDETGGLP
ncbi:hypothetical protein [Burkholderia ubonensis]|uniref:hypothetical protein n=1 Tax=Burkholderia ubonensis TaxID=101571 RepID=UPI0018DF965B|nr:hypothetical protein [Burkholderia ubonensis]